MELQVIRQNSKCWGIESELIIPGWKCFSLELPEQGRIADDGKWYGPISPGKYPVSIYSSPANHCEVILLHDVPKHDAIEVHIANVLYDLKGCIAVGLSRGMCLTKVMLAKGIPPIMGVLSSTNTFNKLMSLVKDKIKAEPSFINIVGIK